MSKKKLVISLSIIAIILIGVLVYFITQKPEEELDIQLPESRSFYMGMTPWPYDFTVQAVAETYTSIKEHGDLIRHYLGDGVPWPEAFEGKPYHPHVENDLNFRLSQLQEGQKVFLDVSSLSTLRDGLAPYWGESGSMERPGVWKNKDFDDPDVITAYINYCRYLIQIFHPDFMAYGVEVNMLARHSIAEFEKFLVFVEQVYGTLKEENPELPIFLTIQIDTFHEDEVNQRGVIEMLLPYTDYIAVSSYPYGDKADPKELPEDWFSEVAAIAPEKPFAVSETGFIAEDLVLYGALWSSGNERWQAEYVEFLLNESNELNAKFVIWFCPRDYDQGWIKMENMGLDELFKVWRDIGLIDGNGNPRLSLRIWDAWLGLPKD